jgi:type I restriction enzyme, S subunit
VGQFAMNKMKAWQGSYGISRYNGIVSPAYFVYDISGVDSDYFHMAARSRSYIPFFAQASDGVRIDQWDLSQAQMREIPFGLPPLPEQAAIVRFLDYIDRRIRRYIRARQKLIALLEEQKQAIIHQAVTRGLDPDAPMKDSGVEWLGEVPAHWEVLALKRVLRRLIDCEHKTAPVVDESQFRVVRTTAVRNGTYNKVGTYGTTAAAYEEWTRRGVPEPGDVIFTREAPAGEACLVPADEPVCLGQRTVLMKPRENEYSAQFLIHMIYCGPPRTRIQLASQGSTVGHFNIDDIGWMMVYRPPLSEQFEIVEYIDRSTKDIDTAIARANREIELLNEYRTRLIADVVTGKLDVREAAANLPAEPKGDSFDTILEIDKIEGGENKRAALVEGFSV